MGAFAAGSAVRIAFPFTDLTQSKVRPAVVLAAAGRQDWVLVMVTSNPFADERAVVLDAAAFATGSLSRVSFVRPARLFTAHEAVMLSTVAQLTPKSLARVVEAVVAVVRGG